MSQALSISAEQLQELLKTVLSENNKLNPIEQKKLDEELARQRRRDMLAVELGRAEEASRFQKQNSCSHMIYPAGHRFAGHDAPKGTIGAQWNTGGQAYQNGLAMIVCQRCQTRWIFRPGPEAYTNILQNGLAAAQPPSDEHTVCIGCMESKPKCKCDEIAMAQKEARPVAVSA